MPYRDEREMFEVKRTALEGELHRLREGVSQREAMEAQARAIETEIADLNKKIGKARRALPLLDSLQIASPCSAKWSEMKGDEVKRFCGDCELEVHNLSAMTREKAEETLQQAALGRVCVRFYRRADNTVLTEDCPVGAKRKRRRRNIAIAAGVSALATSGLGVIAAGFSMMGRPVDPTSMGKPGPGGRPSMAEVVGSTSMPVASAPMPMAPTGTVAESAKVPVAPPAKR